jgi:hypothetical protein
MYGCAINLSFLNAGQDGLLWRLFGRRHDSSYHRAGRGSVLRN